MLIQHDRMDMDEGQERALAFAKEKKRCALWTPMSFGKTVVAGTVIADLIDFLEMHRALVIGPMRVAEKTWPDELESWSHLKGLKFQFLGGNPNQMQKKIDKHMGDTEVWGISCDSLHHLVNMYFAKQHPWDGVIVDEASKFKNMSANRSGSLKLLTIHPQYVIQLTGTQSPNGVEDIWSQIYMLDRGERLGRTMADFKRKFFRTDSGKESKRANANAIDRINQAIKDIVHVVTPDEIKGLKRPTMQTTKLKFPANLTRDYATLLKKLVLEIKDDSFISAANSAALGKKLLQFASGMVYDNEHVAQPIHDIKINALKDIVADNPGTPFLIAYGFQHEVTRLKEAFPEAEKFGTDPKQQDRWNNGEIPMLLAHPKSAGHGLNLQFGGHNLVWFSMDYNLEEYMQLNMRLPRKGQTHEVIINHLIVEDTIDEMVMASLTSKDSAQSSLQHKLKKLIQDTLAEIRRAV